MQKQEVALCEPLGLKGSFQEDGTHFGLYELVLLGGVQPDVSLQFEAPKGS